MQPHAEEVATLLRSANIPCRSVANIRSVTYGKLLINLFNAVNALSGQSLVELLLSRGYRQVAHASIAEALAVYKGIYYILSVNLYIKR